MIQKKLKKIHQLTRKSTGVLYTEDKKHTNMNAEARRLRLASRPKKPPLDFHIALHLDKIDLVKLLLDRDAIDIDLREDDWSGGRTPLQIAVLHGYSKLVDFLLECGASVTSCDPSGMSILCIAASSRKASSQVQIVSTLIRHGADITKTGALGRTPLHMAVLASSANVVELLLKHGADITAVDEDGQTALHCAAWRTRGNTAVKNNIVRMLLSHGTTITAKLDLIFTPAYDSDPDFDSDDEEMGLLAEFLADDERADIISNATMGLIKQKVALDKAKAAQKEAARKSKLVAVSMGLHARLGEKSALMQLSPEMMEMVGRFV
jgi:ankyrin repeat protein